MESQFFFSRGSTWIRKQLGPLLFKQAATGHPCNKWTNGEGTSRIWEGGTIFSGHVTSEKIAMLKDS